MSNLIFNRESTLPSYELTTSRAGEIIGIKVRRFSHSVYYHRTGRGLKEMLDTKTGELHALFGSAKAFAQFAEDRMILDLGCGDGKWVAEMSKLGSPILGLDLHLTETQKSEPVFIQGDAFRLPFGEKLFDCIVSSWSVFHYEPLAQLGVLLRESCRALKEGGSLIIPSFSQSERLQEVLSASKKLKMETCLISGSEILVCKKAKP